MPPINELTRIEPVLLARLDRMGIFTTGLLLNLASFGPDEHKLMIQAGIEGLREILDLDLDGFRERAGRAATGLGVDPPTDLTLEGWWDQARTLEDE